jgi:hypothetical protein
MLRQEGGGWEESDEEDFDVQLDVQDAGRERWRPDAGSEGASRYYFYHFSFFYFRACCANPLATWLC